MRRILFLIFISFCLIMLIYSYRIYSQPVSLSFSYITPDMGLSSYAVTSILQDHKGFIWIGTYDGLNRYDGNKFVIYKSNSFDTASLAHNNVWCIFEDHRHNILIGTSGGLCLFDWSTDKFLNYMTSASSPLRGLAATVSSIREDKAGNLWLATDNGLIYFNRKENSARQFRNDPGNPASISNSNIEHVLIDNRGNVWAATWNGINLYVPETDGFKHFLYNPDSGNKLLNASFYEIAEDHTGNLWFGSYGCGLYRLNIKDIDSGKFVHYEHVPDDIKSLSGNRILCLYEDDQDNLWIGTENNGLNLYNRKDETFWHYHSDIFSPTSLNHESINVFYKDKSGNFWIGTFAGGINFSKKNSDAVICYSQIPGFPFSLSHNSVTSLLEDHMDRIWVGTDGGGLDLFDIKTGHFTAFNTKNSRLSSDAVLSIIEDSENQIWLGTWAGGLNLLNPETMTFKSFTTENSTITDNDIFSVAEGKKGHIWLGSFQNGLLRFDKKTGSFTQYTVENSNLSNNMIIDIKRVTDNMLLIGTNNGLNIYDYKENNFITYTHIHNNKKSLSNNYINTILVESDSVAWIGTMFGLNRFNINNQSFTCFYTEDGLPDNVIKGMAFDLSGQLWISTNKGVARFNPWQHNTKNLTKEDGLQSNEFNKNSAIRIKSGAILYGGVRGLNIIYPDKIRENLNIPDIIITDFRIFNRPVEPGVEGSPLKKHISEIKELRLSYRQSVITFDFAVMDYTIPEKNQHAYMMEGFDKDWNYIGANHTATYTNLNPGIYVFKVKGSNNDGIWNEKGTSLKITILPPWWKTLVFKISVIIIIIIIITTFYFYRITSLKKQKIFLEKVVKERTQEIEEKNAILTNQANELNETNTLLEERQQQIEEQAEELRISKEELESVNENLNEINKLLKERQRQIVEQARKLEVQKKKLEDANTHLSELNSTKDKFFSIIAHDLKNPFNTILGFSELLKSKYYKFSDEKRLKYSEVIYDSSKNIYSLLENLLQWARTQTDKIAFEPIVFDLKQIIDQNIMLLKENLTDKKITINHNIKDECKVYADRNMINAVIRNILTNAIKFTNINGEILIKSIEKNGVIEVSIKDNGIGMSEEEIGKLFRVDVNFSRSGTGGETGTGLGLILCREFVEKNGGSIRVESKPGEGSNFLFTIPAA